MTESTSDYRSTLNLPDTPFPMRGDLPKREPAWAKAWSEQGLYKQLRVARRGQPLFVLHVCPPYANASVGSGYCWKWEEGVGRSFFGAFFSYSFEVIKFS